MFRDRTLLGLNLAVFLIMLGVGMIVPLLPQKIINLEGPGAPVGLGMFPALVQPWISVILAVSSLGLGVFYLSSLAYLNEVVPDTLKGTISGAYFLFWGAGMFFGPALVGKLGELSGPNAGFYLFSLLLLLEALLLAAGGRKPVPCSPKYSG